MRPEAIEEISPARRLLLVVPIFVWAVSWPVTKIGVNAIPPIWFGCLRYFVATLCLAPIVGVRGRISIPSRQDWTLVLVSASQLAAFSALTGLALTVIPPGRASVLAYSTPLWVAPFAAWRLKEPLSRKTGLGVVAGLIGVAVIAGPSIHSWEVKKLAGYAMLCGASALWAVSILYVRAHRFVGTALELAPWQMFVATLLMLPAAILAEGSLQAIGAIGALTLAYVGPFATALGYWSIVEAGRHFRATTVSMVLLATPVLGILFSAISLGEAIDGSLVSGIILIGGGIRLAI